MTPNLKQLREDQVQRFWAQITKTRTCWIWNGYVTRWGYGRFSFNGKGLAAHRLSLNLVGIETPPHLVADHICRNKLCVNPNHLRVVTQRVNSLENNFGPTEMNHRKSHCIHGHRFDRENTRTYIREGTLRRACKTCQRRIDAAVKARKIAALKEGEDE
jgi:hypothetical protein